MIDPTFRNNNRLFALLFNVTDKDNDEFPRKGSFDKYSIGLSRQTKRTISQQINGAAMFFIAEEQQKAVLNISLDSLNVAGYYKQWSIQILHLLSQTIDSTFTTKK